MQPRIGFLLSSVRSGGFRYEQTRAKYSLVLRVSFLAQVIRVLSITYCLLSSWYTSTMLIHLGLSRINNGARRRRQTIVSGKKSVEESLSSIRILVNSRITGSGLAFASVGNLSLRKDQSYDLSFSLTLSRFSLSQFFLSQSSAPWAFISTIEMIDCLFASVSFTGKEQLLRIDI